MDNRLLPFPHHYASASLPLVIATHSYNRILFCFINNFHEKIDNFHSVGLKRFMRSDFLSKITDPIYGSVCSLNMKLFISLSKVKNFEILEFPLKCEP